MALYYRAPNTLGGALDGVSTVLLDLDKFAPVVNSELLKTISLVAPAGIGTGAAFGTAKLNQALSLSGIVSGQALGALSVTTGTSVAPAGIATGFAAGTAALVFAVAPGGIASAFAAGTFAAALRVQPGGIVSAFAAGTAQLVETIAPTGVASSFASGVAALGRTASPSGIASAAALGALTVSASATVVPAGIASAAALGVPTVAVVGAITPAGIASAAALGVPSLASGGTTVPVLTGGGGWVDARPKRRPKPAAQTVSAPGIASEVRPGHLGVVVLAAPVPAQELAPSGIASGEALAPPALPQALGALGIDSAEGLSHRVLVLRQRIDAAELERLRRELGSDATRLSVEWYERAQQLLSSPAGLTAVAELLARQGTAGPPRPVVARVARVTRTGRIPRAA